VNIQPWKDPQQKQNICTSDVSVESKAKKQNLNKTHGAFAFAKFKVNFQG
jgi:hypothetical protein